MKDRWKHRRAMAWGAFICGMAFPFLVLFTESDQLGDIAASFYVFVAAVVGAYIGFATVDDRWSEISRHDRHSYDRHGYQEGC
jgi:uncharacterized membrane protein YiaA